MTQSFLVRPTPLFRESYLEAIGIARLSCDVDNIASRRVIEANGGVLLRQCAPSWFAEAAYLLYEIPLI
jgi:predicted acetyltransferase